MADDPPAGATTARALALTGPTGAGKTALSLRVAQELDGEVISMDSRQVYRGLDIGTAKVTARERAAVPHHGLDLVRPGQRYSAGQFGRDARRWIREIRDRGRVPLLVGGTGFFLRSLTEPLFDEPPLDAGRRDRLREYLGRRPGTAERWLERLDPDAARRLEKGGGRQRVMRWLEIPVLTGRTLGWWHRNSPGEPPVPLRVFVLRLPREVLYERINRRVGDMLDAGFLDEVRGLLEQGARPADSGMNATGYRELASVVRGELSLDEAADRIRQATRRYARRQITWFRHQLPEDAVWLDGTRPVEELARIMVTAWRTG